MSLACSVSSLMKISVYIDHFCCLNCFVFVFVFCKGGGGGGGGKFCQKKIYFKNQAHFLIMPPFFCMVNDVIISWGVLITDS